MLILTERFVNPARAVVVHEHFVDPERIRAMRRPNDTATTVITHDGSVLSGIVEAPMTIARMRAMWEHRHAHDEEMIIAVRAEENGDCGFVACIHEATRRATAKVSAIREMADDLTAKADEAQALAASSEAALAKLERA